MDYLGDQAPDLNARPGSALGALPSRLCAFALNIERRRDEGGEERMRLVGLGLEFGVELHREEPRVILELDDLDEAVAQRLTGGHRVHGA